MAETSVPAPNTALSDNTTPHTDHTCTKNEELSPSVKGCAICVRRLWILDLLKAGAGLGFLLAYGPSNLWPIFILQVVLLLSLGGPLIHISESPPSGRNIFRSPYQVDESDLGLQLLYFWKAPGWTMWASTAPDPLTRNLRQYSPLVRPFGVAVPLLLWISFAITYDYSNHMMSSRCGGAHYISVEFIVKFILILGLSESLANIALVIMAFCKTQGYAGCYEEMKEIGIFALGAFKYHWNPFIKPQESTIDKQE